MRHQNSVFHSVLKHVPWPVFDRVVEAHAADARVRRLTTKSQFAALLYGQLSGALSLREIVGGLESHADRLYHLGVEPPRRSTLSDANAGRPAAVFAELLAVLMAQAHRGLRRKLSRDCLSHRRHRRAADRVQRRLGSVLGRGMRCQGHVIYDADADRPIYAAVSAANVTDISVAQQMPIEAGATYVFDLGYYDYGWWAKLDAAQCRIVTRFKSNTPARTHRGAARRPGQRNPQ